MMTQVALIQLVSIQEVIMSEQEIKRGLRLVRYGGVVVTVAVLTSLVAFAMMTGNAIGGLMGEGFNLMLPYIVGLTALTAAISVIFYFVYRAYLMSRAKTA